MFIFKKKNKKTNIYFYFFRLNICRRDEVETTALCAKLQDEIFVKYMENEPEKFGKMAKVLFDGMWYLDPTLDADCFMYFWYSISGLKCNFIFLKLN